MGHVEKKVKRGSWSAEEDEKLVKYINTHGEGDWKSVAENAGLQRRRTSCRSRWFNYLRPGIKRGSFSTEEERTIIDLHRTLGGRWSQIAKHLPGRTYNDLKNHWNVWLKKKLLAQGLDPNTYILSSSIASQNNACSSPLSQSQPIGAFTIGTTFNPSKPSLVTQEAMSSGCHANVDSMNSFLDSGPSNTSTLLSTSASFSLNTFEYGAMREDPQWNGNNSEAGCQDLQKQVATTNFYKEADKINGRLSEEAAKVQGNHEDVHGSFDLGFLESTFDVASLDQYLSEGAQNMGHHEKKAKKQLWSTEEDEKLVKYISTHGKRCWKSVAKNAGLQRSDKSCVHRWIHHLRPDHLKRDRISSEEDRIILDLHRTLGNRWSQIAKHLPGKTDNQVKYIWYRRIKKKLIGQELDRDTQNPLPSILSEINPMSDPPCLQERRNGTFTLTTIRTMEEDTYNISGVGLDPNTHNLPSSNSSETNVCSPYLQEQPNGTFTIGTAFNSSEPSLFTEGAMLSGCHGYVDLLNYFINSIPSNTSTLLSASASSSLKSLEQNGSWSGNKSEAACQDRQKQAAGTIFDKETDINGISTNGYSAKEHENCEEVHSIS